MSFKQAKNNGIVEFWGDKWPLNGLFHETIKGKSTGTLGNKSTGEFGLFSGIKDEKTAASSSSLGRRHF
jgi:hypothetical protein